MLDGALVLSSVSFSLPLALPPLAIASTSLLSLWAACPVVLCLITTCVCLVALPAAAVVQWSLWLRRPDVETQKWHSRLKQTADTRKPNLSQLESETCATHVSNTNTNANATMFTVRAARSLVTHARVGGVSGFRAAPVHNGLSVLARTSTTVAARGIARRSIAPVVCNHPDGSICYHAHCHMGLTTVLWLLWFVLVNGRRAVFLGVSPFAQQQPRHKVVAVLQLMPTLLHCSTCIGSWLQASSAAASLSTLPCGYDYDDGVAGR